VKVNAYVAVKNEIQVKIKFLCLLTLLIHWLWIIQLEDIEKSNWQIENQTRLKLFLPEFNCYLQRIKLSAREYKWKWVHTIASEAKWVQVNVSK